MGDGLMFLEGDARDVQIECLAAVAANREVSDGCARTIASFYHEGGRSASFLFVMDGAVTVEPVSLWRELFGHIDYEHTDHVTRLWMDMMGTYLIAAGMRGAVDGWSQMWVQS